MRQEKLINENKWDNMIILDACRYDYFKKIYGEYFKGKLLKVISPGSCTTEWLEKAWFDYYDKTYVSANPHINSLGYRTYNFHYDARKHFKDIDDVWNDLWDHKLGTVRPVEINRHIQNRNPKRELIIHYVQPHGPYIGEQKAFYPSIMSPNTRLNPLTSSAFNLLGKVRSNFSLLWTKMNIQKIRKAYEDNLSYVLRFVRALLYDMEGKTIITSDHGELLGEHGRFWHPCGERYPELIEVPWLEVNK